MITPAEEQRQRCEETLHRRYEADMVSEDIDTWTMARLKTRLDTLKEAWDDFAAAHNDGTKATIDPDEIGQNMNILTRNEDFYYEAKEILNGYLDNLLVRPDAIGSVRGSPNVRNGQPLTSGQQKQQQVIVHIEKPIDLPTFDGDYTKWQKFKGAFLMEVDERDTLTEHQKLKNLMKAVTGTAKEGLGFWPFA